MKRTKFLKMPPCENPNIDSAEVVAASQILEADGEQAVEVSLFWRGELRARYFVDDETYNTWMDGKWNTCKSKNVIRMCRHEQPVKDSYYYIDEKCIWASAEDKKRVHDFLNTDLETHENHVGWERADRAMERKQARIKEKMAEVPCVPEDAKKWAAETLFPENFLYFVRGENRTIYSCTVCGGKGWKKQTWKQGQQTTCPKCGSPVMATMRATKNRRAPVIILQAYGEQWVMRQFKAQCTWSPGQKEIVFFEELREIMQQGETRGKTWYGLDSDVDELEQEFWDRNKKGKRFVWSYLYPGTLDEILEMEILKRSGLDFMAAHGEKFAVGDYIRAFREAPYLEYLAKARLYKLASDSAESQWWAAEVLNRLGNTLQETLKIDGNRVTRLRELNGGLITLRWLQYEQRTGKKITGESLDWLNKKNLYLSNCEELLLEFGSVNKMVNYLKKQKTSPGQSIIEWRDYLRMAEGEGYDITDSIVRFPKDLKLRHDQLVRVIAERRDEAERKKREEENRKLDDQIEHWLPEAMRYSWQDSNYLIIPARSCQELIEEGRALHHCVGTGDTYMKKMAAGESWILFLRKKEEPEKPYYTIEIDMVTDEIRQWYSTLDRKPDRVTISGVLRKFKNAIGRKRVRDVIVA